MVSGSIADHAQVAPKGTGWILGFEEPSPTLKFVGSNAIQYPSPWGPVSLMAVELEFHVLIFPASVEMKDSPPFVFASVTRKIFDPKVGSVTTELAGPNAGAGGTAFASVPVYAEYVDGAVCAFTCVNRPPSIMLTMSAKTDLLGFAKDFFIRLNFPYLPAARHTCRLAFSTEPGFTVVV